MGLLQDKFAKYDLPQQFISERVPMVVVDRAQIVHVRDPEERPIAGPSFMAAHHRESPVDLVAVEQPGEFVVTHLESLQLIGGETVIDEAEGRDDALGLPLHAGERSGVNLDPDE